MSETRKRKRAAYQRQWQENYRRLLAKQGLKKIRILVHEDFEASIKKIARDDIEQRRASKSV